MSTFNPDKGSMDDNHYRNGTENAMQMEKSPVDDSRERGSNEFLVVLLVVDIEHNEKPESSMSTHP